ncbi:Leucine-rich repeat extensin-like protein 4 [Camellia lanceoleosa]|uniref:Leucine-rich repeat extensin-like protein 4 n=1 Tax=Camellia lanceoleosa TaxID=1840588 RepID=A0ACC0HXY8_9ERIC|nr:Leucine-rich repeat extensin-like protein 4 [Camellia lanceoleosa]
MPRRRISTVQAKIREIFMPALSSTMIEGKIVSWIKSEGDVLSIGESVNRRVDKADMGVEPFYDGILAAIVVGEGGVAPIWKSSITDDPQRVLETWVGSNVCSYKGIFCADLQNEFHKLRTAIVGIDLNSANLRGTLVKELSFLTDLSLIHLNSNRFTGTVPNTFQYLSSLKELDLSNNHFSGPFPTPTLFIPNLLYLNWPTICKEIN